MDPNSIIDNVSNIGLEWYYAFNPPPNAPVSTQYVQPGVVSAQPGTNVANVSLNAGPDSGLLLIIGLVAVLYLLNK